MWGSRGGGTLLAWIGASFGEGKCESRVWEGWVGSDLDG